MSLLICSWRVVKECTKRDTPKEDDESLVPLPRMHAKPARERRKVAVKQPRTKREAREGAV